MRRRLIPASPPRPPTFKRAITKPLLPRAVVSSARINLNKFWDELEHLYVRREAVRDDLVRSHSGVTKSNVNVVYSDDSCFTQYNSSCKSKTVDDSFIKWNSSQSCIDSLSEDNESSCDEDDLVDQDGPAMVWSCLSDELNLPESPLRLKKNKLN